MLVGYIQYVTTVIAGWGLAISSGGTKKQQKLREGGILDYNPAPPESPQVPGLLQTYHVRELWRCYCVSESLTLRQLPAALGHFHPRVLSRSSGRPAWISDIACVRSSLPSVSPSLPPNPVLTQCPSPYFSSIPQLHTSLPSPSQTYLWEEGLILWGD